MSDDKSQTVQYRRFINLSEPCEVRDWAHSLGVAEAPAGPSADKVREYLVSR